MEKKIAVFIKNRQEEALRMSLGLGMLHDEIDVYFIDDRIEQTSKNLSHLETAIEMEMGLYSNCSENQDIKLVTNEEIAKRMIEYDVVLKY